jgi:hypothetical protein
MNTHRPKILRIPSPHTSDFNSIQHLSATSTASPTSDMSDYESPLSTPSGEFSIQTFSSTSAFVLKEKKNLIEAAKELMRKNGQNPDDFGPWEL